jgi:hypothetical protein
VSYRRLPVTLKLIGFWGCFGVAGSSRTGRTGQARRTMIGAFAIFHKLIFAQERPADKGKVWGHLAPELKLAAKRQIT